VHALGVLLYELLTGRSPFRGSNLFQALKLVESLVPAPPSSLRREVPAALDAAVGQALQKRREDRFATARDFAAAVRSAVPEAAEPLRPPERAPRPRWLLVAALFAVAAVGLLLVQAVRAVPRALGGALTDAGTAFGEAVARTVSTTVLAHQHLALGQWASALAHAERGLAEGDPSLLPIAQDEFLLAYHVWPLAAGLPGWLGCCDERQRQRLFGSGSEPATSGPPLVQARWLLGRGDARAALAALQQLPATAFADTSDRRLVLLAAHAVGADRAALGALTQRLVLEADPAARLLAVRWLPAEARAAAFAGWAAVVPIGEPEHWLALRCADACRDGVDAATAAQNAKMAWLNGAGELAVLLDAALPALQHRGAPARTVAPSPEAVLRRVEAAEPADTPASVALRALLRFASGDPAAAEQALAELPASTPAALQPFQDWLAAARSGNAAEHAAQRGLAQARFGDLSSARWQFGLAKTPTANLCAWLLAPASADTPVPTDVPAAAFAAAAELARSGAAPVERLLAAAAAAPAEQRLGFLRLAVLAGAEVDFAVAPWNTYAESPASEAFDEEVNGGLRR